MAGWTASAARRARSGNDLEGKWQRRLGAVGSPLAPSPKSRSPTFLPGSNRAIANGKPERACPWFMSGCRGWAALTGLMA